MKTPSDSDKLLVKIISDLRKENIELKKKIVELEEKVKEYELNISDGK